MLPQETIDTIKPGCKVRIHERVKEKDKERQSTFEGIVIARKHGNEPGGTFTVRAVIDGVGVEKIYPIQSPMIAKVQIIARPKRVRRAKLYFIRKLSGKNIREKLGV